MDLLTAVATSMLGVSRLRAAAIFKILRQSNPSASLEVVLAAMKTPPEQIAALASEGFERAVAALDRGKSAGILPIPWFDSRYPALLACTDDPPPVLWVKGNLEILGKAAVAVIGSRAATPYALQVGRRLGAELAGNGMVVVSGLARGVDSAAHLGCLEAGGATIAVLGSGVDRVYPSEHVELAGKIELKGLVISELGPGAEPLPENFPLRNRIISGISLGTVVVEASDSSGSLITAACALRQGRDVMAVPGSILSGRNRGSHSLLKDGAKVVETADDILEELGWRFPAPTVGKPRNSLTEDPLLAKMEAGEGYRLDDLVEATGMAPSKLLPRLMELELLGCIETAAGGVFIRQERPR
jgi:DNA processing protein